MDNVINKLQPIIQSQQQLMSIQATLLKGQVDDILAERFDNVNKIDKRMDDLFAITPHNRVVEDIKRLNEYLATIDKEAAEYYAEKLQEWML
jgi:hypothetical protein